eukprot:2678516-Rhodomonas_salina.1
MAGTTTADGEGCAVGHFCTGLSADQVQDVQRNTPKSNTRNRIFSANCTRNAVSCIRVCSVRFNVPVAASCPALYVLVWYSLSGTELAYHATRCRANARPDTTVQSGLALRLAVQSATSYAFATGPRLLRGTGTEACYVVLKLATRVLPVVCPVGYFCAGGSTDKQ